MVFKNFTYGLGEMYRGLSISATVRELQKFVPSLKVSDVARFAFEPTEPVLKTV